MPVHSSRMASVRGLKLAFVLAMASGSAFAQSSDEKAAVGSERSPWLLAPQFSSSPKLGTSLGALAGYLHFYDEKSRPSMFIVQAQYTSTDSMTVGAFAKTSYDEDRQRFMAGLMGGNIRNDYSDYLGTGIPLKNNAELRSFFTRYLYRVSGDWFFGAQGMYQNFNIAGDTAFDEQLLNVLGVQPYKSGGLGLVGYRDSRDSDNMPTRGALVSISNMAYREALGGENDYGMYRIDLRYYAGHGNGNVLAIRQLNHLTNDAPPQSRAPVQLRGYKTGQYTANQMSSIEAEERFKLAEKWTATVFAGVAILYGGGMDQSKSSNTYPAVGAGVQYVLKPKEGIVLNLEYAKGSGDNSGILLKMGYAY